VSTGLAVLCGVLLLSTLWLLRSNLQLRAEAVQAQDRVVALERAKVKAQRAKPPKKPPPAARRAEVEASPVGLPEGVERPSMDRNQAIEPGSVDPGALRDRMRDAILERMVEAVAVTAEARGWDEAMAGDAAAILDEAFERGAEVRESVKAGTLSIEEARDEMIVHRERTVTELVELLGEEEYQAFRSEAFGR